MEPRIGELREDFALRKIPSASFEANALHLEVIRMPYNLVTAFQHTCLPESGQSYTLQKLRFKHFVLLGELIRPQNRPPGGSNTRHSSSVWSKRSTPGSHA